MNRLKSFGLVMVALVPAALISLNIAAVRAQSPAPSAPSAAPSPSTTPVPPTAPAAPAPPPAETKSPADMPSTAQTPAPPPPPATQTADPFGEEITLEPKQVVILKGSATWDSAFDTLIDSFKALSNLLDKQSIRPSGNPMIVYTSTDDSGFTYMAEIPVDQEPKNLAKGMSMGKSPEGKSLKFVHRGSYDNMDNTYEAITNYLDEKKQEAKDTFIEEYVTDPLKTEEDKLVINVYVPLK
ncbi:MAG TPA: GyrI-like domain-containing protein [Bradyrhizobium sp.]|nr:GyrI-like domain-containing protein [Bradyrhizobium sp.]